MKDSEEGGGGRNMRLSACACSPYLANAAVTETTQTKQVWEVQAYSIVACIYYVPNTRTLLHIKCPISQESKLAEKYRLEMD